MVFKATCVGDITREENKIGKEKWPMTDLETCDLEPMMSPMPREGSIPKSKERSAVMNASESLCKTTSVTDLAVQNSFYK